MDYTLLFLFLLMNVLMGVMTIMADIDFKPLNRLQSTLPGRIFITCTGFLWLALAVIALFVFAFKGAWNLITTGKLE
jgi:hypothetical protein